MAKQALSALAKRMAADASAEIDTPSNDDMAVLSNALNEQARMELGVAAHEVEVSRLKKEIDRYSREYIPELMAQSGVSQFTTDMGVSVTIKDIIHARLNKDDKPKGFRWLRANGMGALIKTEVKSKFVGEQSAILDKLKKTLAKYGIEFELSEAVHFGTLQKALAEKMTVQQQDMDAGKKIAKSKLVPTVLFNVYQGQAAKVDIKKADTDLLMDTNPQEQGA